MKVLLDTNVLVSGIFFAGKPLEILRAWHRKEFKLIISQDILNEYVETIDSLNRKYPGANAIDIKTIASNAEMTFSVPCQLLFVTIRMMTFSFQPHWQVNRKLL